MLVKNLSVLFVVIVCITLLINTKSNAEPQKKNEMVMEYNTINVAKAISDRYTVKKRAKTQAVSIASVNTVAVEEIPIRPQIDNVPLSEELLNYIFELCLENDIPYELMLAIIAVESNFDSKVISKTKDFGLAQINQANISKFSKAADIDRVDPLNPQHNIRMAVYYLTYLKNYWLDKGLSEEQKFDAVILAYNRGEKGALNWIKTKGWNNEYVNKVSTAKSEMENNTFRMESE